MQRSFSPSFQRPLQPNWQVGRITNLDNPNRGFYPPRAFNQYHFPVEPQPNYFSVDYNHPPIYHPQPHMDPGIHMIRNDALEERDSENSDADYDNAPQIRIDQPQSPGQQYTSGLAIPEHSPRILTNRSTPMERRPLVINFPKVDQSPTGSDDLNPLLDETDGAILQESSMPPGAASPSHEAFIRQAMFRPLFPARAQLLPQPVSSPRFLLTAPSPRWNSSHPQLAPPAPPIYAAFTPPPFSAPAYHRFGRPPLQFGQTLSPPLPPQHVQVNRSLDSIPLRTRATHHLVFGNAPQSHGFVSANENNYQHGVQQRPTFYSPHHQFS